MKHYVFGYGSLINPISLGKTLGRIVESTELTPAFLFGFQRFWGLADCVFSANLNQNVQAVFLDIRPVSDCQCNGIIVHVSETEFATLLIRERNYDRIDITDQLATPPTDGRVTVFAGRSEHQTRQVTPGHYVMQRYIDLVNKGVDLLGMNFATQFWSHTLPNEFPILDGSYSFH